jgi:ribonuclease HII
LFARPSGAPGETRTRAALREDTYKRLLAYDSEIADAGGRFRLVAGVDEAGRGALAGPVVSAAVILPPDPDLIGVNDSKKIPEKTRETLFDTIISASVGVTIALGSPALIDERNILQATLYTMHRAVSRLRTRPDIVLVDGRDVFQWDGPVVAVKKGDSQSLAIAAASVVAKVARDRLMRKLHKQFPHYNFESNKGYGSREHMDAIIERGLAPVHRRSFRPKVVENAGILF